MSILSMYPARRLSGLVVRAVRLTHGFRPGAEGTVIGIRETPLREQIVLIRRQNGAVSEVPRGILDARFEEVLPVPATRPPREPPRPPEGLPVRLDLAHFSESLVGRKVRLLGPVFGLSSDTRGVVEKVLAPPSRPPGSRDEVFVSFPPDPNPKRIRRPDFGFMEVL